MYRVGKSQLLNYCYDASKLQPIVGHLFCEMIKGSPTVRLIIVSSRKD